MKRKNFLALAATIGLAVGIFALTSPAALLASKGVASGAAALVWTREVGVLLIAASVTAFLVRGHAASATLRAILIGNVVLQLGLLPIEPIAYMTGTITSLAGIVPNTLLHIALAAGFGYHVARMENEGEPA